MKKSMIIGMAIFFLVGLSGCADNTVRINGNAASGCAQAFAQAFSQSFQGKNVIYSCN